MCVQGVGGSRGQKWGPLAPEADFGLEVPLSLSAARLWMHFCDRMGCSKQPPKHLLGTFTPSIKELSVYHSGGQGGMRGSPLQSKTSHLIAHQRHHPSAMQRGQIPHYASPAHLSLSPKHPQCLPRAESFLVLMILAAYSCPANTFTHLRTMEKAPLGTEGARGEGLGVGTGTAQPSRGCGAATGMGTRMGMGIGADWGRNLGKT